MSLADPESSQDSGYADILSDPAPLELAEPGRLAAHDRAEPSAAGLRESLSRVASLAATVLNAPCASIVPAGTRALPGLCIAAGADGQQGSLEQRLCADVVTAGTKLIIGDTRSDSRASAADLPGTASLIAWAGVPVHDQDGQVAGVLWAADLVPRQWNAENVAVLETLAQVASNEIALRAALAHSSARAALAHTLEESLLPPPLTTIPGLQVAARYAPGGTGSEVLGDFCDVFPSVGRTWGVVVGDVCGKGSFAARRTALARYALRAVARRATRPGDLTAAAMAEAIQLAIGTFSGGRLSDDTVVLVVKVP